MLLNILKKCVFVKLRAREQRSFNSQMFIELFFFCLSSVQTSVTTQGFQSLHTGSTWTAFWWYRKRNACLRIRYESVHQLACRRLSIHVQRWWYGLGREWESCALAGKCVTKTEASFLPMGIGGKTEWETERMLQKWTRLDYRLGIRSREGG